MVLAVSLSKAYGSAGGAVIAGDPAIADQILVGGGPIMFGGPIQVPELAAGVAAADILLSPSHEELQRRLLAQIDFVIERARSHGVQLTSQARTPIWFAHIGPFGAAREIASRVRERGFWINLSAFPVVPFGQAGIRFTNTLSQSEAQIDALLETIADVTRDVMGTHIEVKL
jgi:7-keto-8-aminopelargonate synthetase-like enzyme